MGTLSELSEEGVNALNMLTDGHFLSSVPAHPNSNGQMTVEMDASDVQVMCLLFQQQNDDTAKPIEYWKSSLRRGSARIRNDPKEMF